MAKKFDFKKIGKRALGAVAGGAAASLATKATPAGMNPKIAAGLKILIGCAVPELAPKNDVIGTAGIAFAGAASKELADTMLNKGTGVQGIGDPEYVVGNDEYQVEGANEALSGGDNDALGEAGGNAVQAEEADY